MKLFTRQTLSAVSLSRLLPYYRDTTNSDNEFWDVCSVASLTRNLMEGCVALFYSGTEVISAEEAELRFFLSQYHRNREWQLVRKRQTPENPEIAKVENSLRSEMKRLKEHPFLPHLSLAQRNKVLKGDDMYLTKADLEERFSVVGKYRLHYQLISNLVHPLPLSIERIDNNQGRGNRVANDVLYMTLCLSLAAKFLAASVSSVCDRFPDLENLLAESLVRLRIIIVE